MSGRNKFSDAILLRSVDYGDADRIVTLLTRSYGKLSLIARGARRSQKRFMGALEPFALITVELAPGRGRLGRLAQAHLARAFPRLLTRLDAMNVAGAALELARELSPEHHAEPESFDACVAMLEALDRGAAAQPTLVAFSVRALSLAGFAPRLDRCAGCGKVAAPAQSARFDPAKGSVICRACGGGSQLLSGEARAILHRCKADDWGQTLWAPWPVPTLDSCRSAVEAFARHRLERRVGGNV